MAKFYQGPAPQQAAFDDLNTQVDTLNSNIQTYSIGDFSTLSALESALVTYVATLPNNGFKNILFGVNPAFGVFQNTTYQGTIRKWNSNRFRVEVTSAMIVRSEILMNYNSGTWTIDENALNSKLTLAVDAGITSDYGTFTYKQKAIFGNLAIIKVVLTIGNSNVPTGSKLVKGLPWASTNFAVIEGWDYTSGKSRRFTINASGELETLDEAIPSGNSIRIISTYVSA